MKNQLLLVFCLMLGTFLAKGQETQFPMNSKGMIEFSGTINTSLDVKEFFDKAELWAVGNKHILVFKNTETSTITIKCALKGKTSYNPFAGQFTESYDGVLRLTYHENKIDYTLSDIYITNTYMGYGASTTTLNAEDKLAELEKVKTDKANAENNAELSKKKRKDIIEDCDDKIAQLSGSLKVTRQFADEIIASLKVKFE